MIVLYTTLSVAYAYFIATYATLSAMYANFIVAYATWTKIPSVFIHLFFFLFNTIIFVLLSFNQFPFSLVCN